MKAPTKDYSFRCPKCRKTHQRNSYCIAQQASGHTLYLKCDCGKKITVPPLPK